MLMRSLSIRQGYKKCADQPDDFSCEISEDIGNSAHPFEVDTQKCDQITQPGKVHAGKKGFSSNIFVLVPLIFSGSLLLGTFFYKMHHGWELSTAFYFSAQVLAGDLNADWKLDPNKKGIESYLTDGQLSLQDACTIRLQKPIQSVLRSL